MRVLNFEIAFKRIMFLINEYEKTGDATALVTKMFPLTADHPRKDSISTFTYIILDVESTLLT